jgi:hypothetical protein
VKEDLSGWIKCYGSCGSYIWRTHEPNFVSYHSFVVHSCKICNYLSEIKRYKRQYQLDLFNKVSKGLKWVRDTEDRSVERVIRTTAWMFKTLDVDKALEVYEEAFDAHVNKITQLWVRNLRLELSNRRQ